MGQNPQETAALVAFTGYILNGKLYFFCAVALAKYLSFSQLHLTGFQI